MLPVVVQVFVAALVWMGVRTISTMVVVCMLVIVAADLLEQCKR